MKLIPDVRLARHIARCCALYTIDGGEPCATFRPDGAQATAIDVAGKTIPFTESLRQDVEALAAADLLIVPDHRAPGQRLVARFSVHDATVVLRRLAYQGEEGLTRFGEFIGLPEDEAP